MTEEEQKKKENGDAGKEPEKGRPQQDAGPPHPWESELGDYPLRAPGDDPGWVVKTMRIWLGIALASGVFIVALIVLGFFYD
jgi:hypothetical protein